VKRTPLLGLLLATAIATGCTTAPYSTPPTSGPTVSATGATANPSGFPKMSVRPATTSAITNSTTAPISSEAVRAELRGVHWVLTSLQRRATVTDVRAFTPVFLELTTSHFTVDTGVRVFMFHYTGGERSLLLGSPPPYAVTHGGYTRELGPAPLMLNDVLQTYKTLKYAITGDSLRLSAAGGLVLNFRGDGLGTMHYWSEPDN
jgi:hypothetical protein